MIYAIADQSARDVAARLTAKMAGARRCFEFLPIHTHDFVCRFAHEQIDVVKVAGHPQALFEEMPRPGQCPTPARRFDLDHWLVSVDPRSLTGSQYPRWCRHGSLSWSCCGRTVPKWRREAASSGETAQTRHPRSSPRPDLLASRSRATTWRA